MPQATVSYCQYGSKYMKPTDLWGRLPPSFVPKMCRPKRQHQSWWKTKDENGRAGCPHAEVPRGSGKGICGIGGARHIAALKNERGYPVGGTYRAYNNIARSERAALRAVIPYGLSLAMCEAAERDLA